MTKPKQNDPRLVNLYLKRCAEFWPASKPTQRSISLGLQRREIVQSGDVAFVPLTRDLFAIIDADDTHLVEGVNWCASVGMHGLAYAVTGAHRVGQRVWMHRVLLSATDGVEVDHKDGNGLNNRRSNLRLCTRAENQRNRGVYSSSVTGFKGVSWVADHRQYKAQIDSEGKKVFLGYYATPQEASRAYEEAANELYGEFARLDWDPAVKMRRRS